MRSRKLTLWILGGAALAIVAAAACGSAGDHGGGQVALAQPRLRDMLDTVTEVPAGYVHVPGGMIFHQDCVRTIPDGAQVDEELNVTLNGVRIEQFSPCAFTPYRHVGLPLRTTASDVPPPLPATTGWVENSFSGPPTQAMFTAMNPGTWVVPAAPTRNDGQIIYLFPSLLSDTFILQPVLQWGSTVAGGGAYWAMANWAVYKKTAVHGAATMVNPGDQISASMVMAGRSANATAWNVTWTDVTTGATATDSLVIPDGNLMNSAQAGVLEVVNVSNCSDFPATGFTQFGIPYIWEGNDYTGRTLFNPGWSIVDPTGNNWTGPACGYNATVTGLGATQLYY